MPAPAPPEVVDAALLAVADGASQRSAAAIAGVSQGVVSKWTRRLEDRMEGWRTRLRARWARNVLRDVDGIVTAQAQAASDPTCRHGPQAARVLLEGAGIIGGVRDLTINGDVDASTNVTVDARRVSLIQGARGAELDAHVSDLAKDLGLAI